MDHFQFPIQKKVKNPKLPGEIRIAFIIKRSVRCFSSLLSSWRFFLFLFPSWLPLEGDIFFTGRIKKESFDGYNRALEFTPKAKHRYRQKVQEYALDIEMNRRDFTEVLFITCSNRIFYALREATVDYPNIFQVVSYEEILGGG